MHQGFAAADFLNDPVLLFAVVLLLLVVLAFFFLFRKRPGPVWRVGIIVFLVLALCCLAFIVWLAVMWGQPPAAAPVPAPAFG